MKAAAISRTGPADVLTYTDLDIPDLGPDEIRVKTAYAAVNPVDVWTRMGVTGIDLPFPCILGWDVAGTLEAAGADVTQFRVGEPVMGMVKQMARLTGTYAEYITAPAELFARVPAGLNLDTAAAAPLTGLTASQLVDKARLDSDSNVLVTGAAGAVGRIVVQLLIQHGHRVSGIARASDADDLTALGIAAAYSSPDDASAQAFDAVLDTAGLPETIRNVRDGGQFISITDNEQPEPERGIEPGKNYVEESGTQLAVVAQQLANGELSLPLHRIYPLSDASAAHKAFEQGGVRGKILLAP
ncbi:NADP-dependent oxidoreductase [Nesterenkonia sp. CL21]|uniref:NADP-dependent oxidoreductase n=1 Tax=Nesterenkonia sp. CL21 TaxID=3064894 RepID=UPI00287B0F82|nr:NADP-dependent oxidoreductase [Nesterenkonia sp. CL21]MDS2171841.1 NADP-dependent oxidoreductase [Nesterenkonia sp. CL21]